MKTKKKKLITSALPYVNNFPHLGNLIGCVLSADVYARFCRSRGYETLYVCGSDEYGTATENKAREEGLTPQQICDKYWVHHDQVYKDFNISFNSFGRTSTPEQTEITQGLFHDLEKNGFISEKTTQRSYCEVDDMFLADRFVLGTCPFCQDQDARGDQCDRCGHLLDPEMLIEPRCKRCGTRPARRETTHLYLDLDKIQPKLEAWFEKSSSKGNWSNNAIRTTRAWLDKGLESRAITRDLKWGVPVPKPGFENKVFYVWYDAPIGYLSISARHTPDWKEWWQNPDGVELYQFMAKDNIPFHTVIFPSTLIGSGGNWTKLHHISSTEYLNYEDTKFSKSRNIGVFGSDVRQTEIPIDLWRFYLLKSRPENNDSVFQWDEFFERVNSEFLNIIGNLVHRTLVFLANNFEGKICDFELTDPQAAFVQECKTDMEGITQGLEAVALRDTLNKILALGKRGNKFFQDQKPWEQVKTTPELAHATVSVLAYMIRSLAVTLEPYVPGTSEKILTNLNLGKQTWAQVGVFEGLDGHVIGKPEILYPKLDMKLAEKFRKKFSGNAPEFGKFRIVVGRIESVVQHTEGLYLLRVNLGEDQPRQIVAGLTRHYSAEELANRQVLVLANLAPAEIQDARSEGMVLVGQKKKKMELLDGSPFQIGDTVVVDEQTPDHSEITIDVFKQAPLKLTNNQVFFDDQLCRIGETPITTSVLANGKIS